VDAPATFEVDAEICALDEDVVNELFTVEDSEMVTLAGETALLLVSPVAIGAAVEVKLLLMPPKLGNALAVAVLAVGTTEETGEATEALCRPVVALLCEVGLGTDAEVTVTDTVSVIGI